MKITGDVDVSGVLAGLQSLADEKLVSLARSMGVAGGQVLRDEAKAFAPEDTGRLRDSIYLAFKDGRSTEGRVIYSVTWNSRLSPHGHLLEFGHWQTHARYLKDGTWYTGAPLASPEWVPAHSFLRPAYMAASGRAIQAMQVRGAERFAELMVGGADEP